LSKVEKNSQDSTGHKNSILGMMSTLLLQNGSTLVSILVGMIASGCKLSAFNAFNQFRSVITVHQAIPFLIGSEIGASLTNGEFSQSYTSQNLPTFQP
jgi:hypothetical protein